MKLNLLIISLIFFISYNEESKVQNHYNADAIVYGGTSGVASSSNIAFGSIRMEPVFMILGQRAGTVAAIPLEKSIPIHELNYEDLKLIRRKDGRILELDSE